MANNTKYQLPTLAPINVSLTAGTIIPSPPESPIARTPTPGGGPLSSHPTTPKGSELDLKAPTSNPLESSLPTPTSAGLSPHDQSTTNGDAIASPLSPTPNPLSPAGTVSTNVTAGGSRRSVRSFLGLRSFSASAASSADWNRPDSAGMLGKRPSSPSVASSAAGTVRKRKSAVWFRRTSSIFGPRSSEPEEKKQTDGSSTDGVSSPTAMGPPPPKLPELAETLDGGNLGGMNIFQDIK